MFCDWERNRRSGVALALRHRLKWFIHLRAHGLSKGDEHPTNTLRGVWYSFFTFYSHAAKVGALSEAAMRPSICPSVACH